LFKWANVNILTPKAAGFRSVNLRCRNSRGKKFFRGTHKIQNPHKGDFDFVAGESTSALDVLFDIYETPL